MSLSIVSEEILKPMTKPLLEDRPINAKDRRRRMDGAGMLVTIHDDLSVVKRMLETTDVEIEPYSIQRVYASNEWDGIADLCPDVPEFDDMRKTNWSKLEQNVRDNKDDINEGVDTQLIPFDREHLIQHIDIALEYLKVCYNEKQYETENVYEGIVEIYDSQAFCMVTQPLLRYPQLANAYRREIQKERKQRSGSLPKRL